MKPTLSEKLLNIVAEIDERGHADLTRLTVLKKWFARAERLSAFALWIAKRASSRKGKIGGAAAEFFNEARRLLAGVDPLRPALDREAADSLYGELSNFQSEYRNHKYGLVRIVHHWDLMLVEQGLGIWLWHTNSPARGYTLAADYCRHYDARYGEDLNGPSADKIKEIGRFVRRVEEREERSKCAPSAMSSLAAAPAKAPTHRARCRTGSSPRAVLCRALRGDL